MGHMSNIGSIAITKLQEIGRDAGAHLVYNSPIKRPLTGKTLQNGPSFG